MHAMWFIIDLDILLLLVCILIPYTMGMHVQSSTSPVINSVEFAVDSAENISKCIIYLGYRTSRFVVNIDVWMDPGG